jgi:hypothetical protein
MKRRKKPSIESQLPRVQRGTVSVLGIDPGLNGGVAYIGPHFVSARPMPICKFDGQEYVDSFAFSSFVEEVVDATTYVFIERCHSRRGNSAQSMFKFGTAYGAIIGPAVTFAMEAIAVTPTDWQGLILPGVHGRSSLKRASVEWATRHYPAIDFKNVRRAGQSDGMADAVCIAAYGLAMLTGTIGELTNRKPEPVRQGAGRKRRGA